MTVSTRPPLRHIAPWTYFSSWAFAAMNVFFIAPSFFINKSVQLPLVGIFPYWFWMVVFISMGLAMSGALLRNYWKLVKGLLYTGLVVKAMFAWGLVFTLFISPGGVGIVGIWIGLMTWQMLCIVYFTPKLKDRNGDG